MISFTLFLLFIVNPKRCALVKCDQDSSDSQNPNFYVFSLKDILLEGEKMHKVDQDYKAVYNNHIVKCRTIHIGSYEECLTKQKSLIKDAEISQANAKRKQQTTLSALASKKPKVAAERAVQLTLEGSEIKLLKQKLTEAEKTIAAVEVERNLIKAEMEEKDKTIEELREICGEFLFV